MLQTPAAVVEGNKICLGSRGHFISSASAIWWLWQSRYVGSGTAPAAHLPYNQRVSTQIPSKWRAQSLGLESGHVLGWSVTSEQMQLGSAVSSRLYGLAVSKSGFESLKAQLNSNVVGPRVCLPNEGPFFPCTSLPGVGCRQSTAQGDAQDTAHGEEERVAQGEICLCSPRWDLALPRPEPLGAEEDQDTLWGLCPQPLVRMSQKGFFQFWIAIAIYPLVREIFNPELSCLGTIFILLVNALLLPISQVAECFADESKWRKKALISCLLHRFESWQRGSKVVAQRYSVNKITKYNAFLSPLNDMLDGFEESLKNSKAKIEQ